jgi:hypothetical protein
MSDRSTSSGRKTASTQISVNPGFLAGFDVVAAATGTTTLILYDSATSDTTGKLILAEAQVDAGMPSLNHVYFLPIVVNEGIYVDLAGSGSYVVHYGAG